MKSTLKLGDRSDAVKVWQSLIGVKADGVFGPATDAATRAFQTKNGLTADGVVGPMTWAAAERASTSPPAASPASEPRPVPNAPVFIPAVKTPATAEEVYNALRQVWIERIGSEPKRESLLVLCAQWAFETGRGRSMWNWNLGNQKGRPGGSDGRSWTFFACNEILSASETTRLVGAAKPRTDGKPGLDAVVTKTLANNQREVWFYPDNPACCFRAYRGLLEGARDYFDLLRKRFASAWPAVEAGDPAQFSRLLKQARYYTADESLYTRSLVSIFTEYGRSVAVQRA